MKITTNVAYPDNSKANQTGKGNFSLAEKVEVVNQKW